MTEYIMPILAVIMALSGIMNVVLISRMNVNSKKNLKKRMELAEKMREYNKKHDSEVSND